MGSLQLGKWSHLNKPVVITFLDQVTQVIPATATTRAKMKLNIRVFAVLLQYSFYGSTIALSCTSLLQSLDCLPVFTHNPASLRKCYCSTQCPDLQDLRDNCRSGQLQTDPCGVCLQCAPGFGETCGGFANADGTCAGGLGCLVKYNPRVEAEHNMTGQCVVEQGRDCQNVGSGVSCRPGQLGVPSDFVFCPAESQQSQQSDCGQKNKKKTSGDSGSGSGFLFSPGSTLHSIVTGVTGVMPSVPDTVREI